MCKMLCPTCKHILICIIRDGENMGRGLHALFAPVGRHDLRLVHRQPLVRVDGDAEESRVGLRRRTEGERELDFSEAEMSLSPLT